MNTVNPNYRGLFEGYATFKCDDRVKEGCLVKMKDNATVTVTGGGDEFIGVVHSVRNGLCSVQMKGFVTTYCLGGFPSLGYSSLCANSDCAVMPSLDDKEYLVVETDYEKSLCTFLL